MSYSLEGLEQGIEHARKNIDVLEVAIDKERETIKKYRRMIESIETSEKLKMEAVNNINIEVVTD